jgi:antimicrobial peptide system SdpA family protein
VIWPQGWSFFADAPQADTLVAYRTAPDGATRQTATYPQMTAQNRWGLGRIAYAQIAEIRELAAEVPDDTWRDCQGDDACLRPPNRPYDVTNGFWRPTLCGPLTLAVEAPAVPRAQRPAGDHGRVIRRVAAVQVDCVGREGAR